MTTIPITTDADDENDQENISDSDYNSNEDFTENQPSLYCYERMVTVLRDGNEIQRISVLRTLPGMLSDRNSVENCLVRVIPEIQETLTSGSVGLELHFEASQAYKDIVEQASHTDPGLCQQILQGIVQNLDAQDSIACSAWLETLLDIITHLPLHLVHTTILPLAVHKAQQLNSIQSRLMASKLLGRLAYKLDPVDVKVQIVPLVQSLCQDNDAGIRASVCQQLSIVAYSLLLPELKSVALPLVIEFSKDEDESVREANLETLVSLLSLFDDETCSQILVPLVERFVVEILERKSHKTLVALSKNYGALCQGLNRVLSFKQKDWFMEKFTELCVLGAEDEDEENDGEFHKMEYIARKFDPQTTFQTCRENAAFNFPVLAQLAGTEKFKTCLLPHFKKLCQDSETEVRRNVASGFHEMVKFMGSEAPILIDSFIDLVYSGEPEVIAALTAHLSVTLDHLYQVNSRTVDANGNFEDNVPYSHTQLTRILLACNRLIRNCSNWRCHEQYLLAMTCMSKCVSKDVLMSSYVPMIKEEVFNTRALPCRLAALTTLILWMKDLTNPIHLQSIIDYLTSSVIQHKSCHKRTLYLDACQLILDHLPSQFFKQYFFRPALKLAKDPVLNIRTKLCKMLPLFKKSLFPSNDYELLSELELVVRNFMSDCNNGYMNEILRNTVNELSSEEEVKDVKPLKQVQTPVANTVHDIKASLVPIKREEKKTIEVVAVAPVPKHQTTTVVYLHQDLDVKAKLPPPIPNHKSNNVNHNEGRQQEVKPVEEPKKTRSPSPPRRPLVTTSISSGVPKKTAVIKPRQLVTRSPSPRPPFKEDLSKKPPTVGARSSSTSSTYPRRSSDVYSTRSSDSYSSKASDSYKSSDSPSSYHSKYSSSSSERIVPIKLVNSSSSSNSSSLRPPTPIATYKRQKDRERERDRLMTQRQNEEAKINVQTRNIPIVRTGSVLKSVEKFEAPDLNSNRPPVRTSSSASSSNLGYSRALNRSFSSFSSSRGLGDYNNNADSLKDRTSSSSSASSYGSSGGSSLGSSSLRRSSLATSSSMSSPLSKSYSLTRVRSGSSIVPSSTSSYSRSQRI